ncbi:DUF7261 family protein [Halopiger goleimassiliensis]|uniref:DUF7261 family protein n=1 Tax=Halopiger goleimassiliensis TaxID=1293048 RepID=UPI000677B959|nr:hypothetical protein [Halopiger goleimassiliensis]
MVTRSNSDHRSRGQVILVGAVALAFIILGIVVVFNGVLYTETISSSSTSQGASHAELAEVELEKGVAQLGHGVNVHEGGDENALADAIENGDGFNDLYRTTTANGRSAVTDVSDVDVVRTAGTVLSDIDPADQDRINFHNRAYIGHFSFEIEGSDDGEIQIGTGLGETVTIDTYGSTLEIETDAGDRCSVEAEEAVFDLVSGAVDAQTDCTSSDLSIIDPEQDYTEVRFDRDRIGSYDIVATEDTNNVNSGDGIWAVSVDVTYDSNRVSYQEADREIEIYGGNR